MRARKYLLAAIALLGSSVPFALSSPPAKANVLPPLGIIVRGHGNGHGRGMSQYGALGFATKLNYTWQDIINFYYGEGGRSLGALTAEEAATSMTVRLQELDGKQTAVVSDNASATWVGRGGSYGALIARRSGNNTYNVYASASATCGASSGTPSGFTQIATNATGPIEFATTNSGNATAAVPADLIGVCEPATSSYGARIRYYRGSVRATADSAGSQRSVNVVPIEWYLRGVVPRESPASWGDIAGGLGLHALRAQAVGARSYSVSENRYPYAKTCDTQDCQVYGGAALRYVGSSTVTNLEDSRTDQAIAETNGYVVRNSNGTIVRTEFTSSNGGRTAGGTFPVKVDQGDLLADSPNQSWTRLLSSAAVQAKYPTIGVLLSITTTHDGLGGDWNGYATSVAITGTAGTVTRTGWAFRGDWDLYAPWFETTPAAFIDPAAAPVGSILFVGDSVSESIASEFASIVTPAYPSMTYQACAGRGMAGADCLFTVSAPQLDLDGVGVVNALPAPAVAIIALGYNDDPATFESELSQMMSALSAKAVQRVIFVNMSTRSTSKAYARSNAALNSLAASNPSVTVLDWNGASSAANQWRWFDNTSVCCWVHLSTSGQAEFALFLRAQLDALRAQGLLPTTAPTASVIPGLPISKTTRGAMVTTVQKRLNTVLKLTRSKRLSTDGVYGRSTINAVKTFQKSVNLPITGKVDRATWDALGLGTRSDLAVFTVGSRHDSVKSVQRALAKVLRKKISATGIYTSTLANYVKTFQKRAKITVNGKVGPKTWTALMATAALA